MQPARLDAVMRFLFRPDGRIARQEFVLGIGLVLAVFAAFNVPLWREDPPAVLAVLAFMAVSVPLAIAYFVLVVKRCHDIGLPASYVLLLLVPVLGIVWLAFLAVMPGTGGPNAYGPAPAFAAD